MLKLHSLFLILVLLSPTITFIPRSTNDEREWLLQYINADPYSTYNYARRISEISLNTSIAHYSYRVAGSPGEKAVNAWIKALLASWGLRVWEEKFQFITWDIYDEPRITIFWNISEPDGSQTFRVYPEHYTYGTDSNDIEANITFLPLPKYFSMNPLPSEIRHLWSLVNTTNKIVLIGREIIFNSE